MRAIFASDEKNKIHEKKKNDQIIKSVQLNKIKVSYLLTLLATPPDRGWQRNEGLLLLHSFLSFDILVAFSILGLVRLRKASRE